ncbi:hypothetical protein [Metallibacterium scheffleri]|uniref:hypothetical protein n=1 Tax=Metallibacterium scheffleri TaxID=993689 RepID=UPI0023F25330|nr:hypothetical protein [Metallibacterium scheffleri]
MRKIDPDPRPLPLEQQLRPLLVTRVRQFALEFRSFRLWNHGAMRVFGPDFGNVV